MDLFIQTLTGTLFELRVNPFETILSIKGKVQRLEGIPISQQHLIWKSVDLQDDYCLHDYGIKSGTTLTLVLAMRDGPINMRRVSADEPEIHEIEEYMDANRDEIWENLCDDKQVTLLVFRDGDQLNFYRVYDQSTDSFTPYSDSVSSSSVYNHLEDLDNSKINNPEKQSENAQTKDKMETLKKKLEAVRHSKKKKPRPPSNGRPSSKLANKRYSFTRQTSRTRISREAAKSKPDSPLARDVNRKPLSGQNSTINGRLPPPHPPILPPVRRSSKGVTPSVPSSMTDDKNRIISASDKTRDHAERSSACSSCAHRRKLPSLHDMSERISRLNKSREKSDVRIASRSRRRVLKPLGYVDKNKDETNNDDVLRTSNQSYETTSHREQLPDILSSASDVESYKKLLNWVQPKSNENLLEKNPTNGLREISRNKRNTPDLKLSSRLRSVNLNSKENMTHLPPVHHHIEKRAPPSLSGKKKTRCTICTKKLGLATTYQCRCGGKFCATHRYPETHTCSYDYKTEGRKFLEKNNPVVTAPKLPKI